MIEQRTEAWHKQRAGLITGSRVGGILGLCPFNKPDDVMRSMVRDHHGAKSEFNGNIATAYGNDNEGAAIFALEMELDIQVIETGFHKSDKYPWLGASPDGLVGDDAVVEIKCPFGKRDALSADEFKSLDEQPNYYAQMQIEMICANTSQCHFYQWAEGASKYELVERNEAWAKDNIPKLKAFYDEYLKVIESDELSAPHLEDSVCDMSLDEEWVKAEAAFVKANELLSNAKDAFDAAKSNLLELANGRKCSSTCLTVFPVERKGAIKYAQIIKDQSIEFDAEKYQSKPSISWNVRVK